MSEALQLNAVQASPPAIPKRWNYSKSVKHVHGIAYKWKDLTLDLATELYIAREILSNQGARTDLKETHTWEGYCEQAGIERRTADRWLDSTFNLRTNVRKLELPPLPKDKHRTIVLDPPWPVAKIMFERRGKEQQAMDYATMELEEIKALPIQQLADPDGCHVYLWITHHLLPFGFDLFTAWGVRYECLLTWNKPTAQPLWWRFLTEHCLFGKIGSLAPLKKGCAVSFSASQQKHSHKPEEFYDLVRAVSPEPRLTMFDYERDGFTQWGIKH